VRHKIPNSPVMGQIKEMFVNEVKAMVLANQLGLPNVAKVVAGVAGLDGSLAIVMEKVNG